MSDSPFATRFFEWRRRNRIGYHRFVKGRSGDIALNWNLWGSERRIALYVFRFLVEVYLPHRVYRGGDKWKTWTLGTASVTWFDREEAK